MLVARAPHSGDAATTEATVTFFITMIFFRIGVYRMVATEAAATVRRSKGLDMKQAMSSTRM
jgi:hypothetical protein